MPTLAAVDRPMGTKTGSRFPSAKSATGLNLPSLKITSFAGRATATRMALASSAPRGLASPEATFRASSSEVAHGVGRIASRLSRSRPRSSVNDCSTRAVSAKLMTMATSPELIWSISSRARRLASSSREGATSVACMLAELSTKRMKRLPERCIARQCGRTRATIAAATSSSCSSRRRLRRSRCQIVLTCRSSIERCHK